MIKMALRTMAAAALFLLLSSDPASAGYLYEVTVKLQYGGTLTGTITLNAANTAVSSYDLVATSTAGSPGFTFPGFEYTTSDSVIAVNLSNNVLTIDAPTKSKINDQLQLVFTNAGLTATGGTLVTGSSYEYEKVAGSRNILSGTVVAIPEPSSLALCGMSGAIGLVLARGRRKRAA